MLNRHVQNDVNAVSSLLMSAVQDRLSTAPQPRTKVLFQVIYKAKPQKHFPSRVTAYQCDTQSHSLLPSLSNSESHS